ncbi:CRISPR-associated helicase/endonuclease Cas3 [Selenomonas sp. KH1T6]|uniref:CRISPR-associated helicase/endonuclease Cas3 n=1 Tax=Selenomonas sp. KH1T6 TaxID=3158784 RepID=UPI0008A7FBD7|nr:CRISPR-associated endonuclease/helicase Cas3 [Selenomonas ruminantium]
MAYLAHKNQEDGREQLLIAHLRGVSERAGEFAEAFGEQEAGELVGLYHDIGKYSAEFQEYLQRGGGRKVDHSTAGAIELMAKRCQISVPSAFCVAGHHGGLMDGGNAKVDTTESRNFFGRMKRRPGKEIPDYRSYREEFQETEDRGQSSLIGTLGRDKFAGQFYIRMLFSCLVDADFLDTEDFMQEDKVTRGGFDTIETLKGKLDEYIAKHYLDKNGKRYGEPINQRRRKILEECISNGDLVADEGLWSLTVPTGGGKTVSSLAFALHHAVRMGKKRIIYVIPYTSIIEQNAKVFRDILGNENIIEHHCNAEYRRQDNKGEEEVVESDNLMRWQLATENWDAPLIVTTNVQFFESLFANRTSRCRKLHNIAGSVVIFDEAQMLPVDYLLPCVAAINELTEHYGVTAVLCTATQPSLDKIFYKEYQRDIREICHNVVENYDFFRRNRIQLLDEMVTVEDIASRLCKIEQVLCIVNTKKAARLLYEELQSEDGVFYLSTNLCPRHRRSVLEKIREALASGKPCRVVSTSLIEAGVDVDFPCVYRELAGLDSIVQAAGRCNREGRNDRDDSWVYVFAWADKALRNAQQNIKACRGATEYVAETHGEDLGASTAISSYFEFLHKLDGGGLDKKKIMELVRKENMPFAKLAENFVLIETPTRPVLIPYDEDGREMERQLRAGIRSRKLMREAGQYMVNVYCGKVSSPFEKLVAACMVDVLDETVAILAHTDRYDESVGLKQEVEDGQGIMF